MEFLGPAGKPVGPRQRLFESKVDGNAPRSGKASGHYAFKKQVIGFFFLIMYDNSVKRCCGEVRLVEHNYGNWLHIFIVLCFG